MSDTKDRLSLKGILDAAEKIVDFSRPFSNADDFFTDQKSFDAVCMNFVVIGEMVDRISDEFRQTNSEIDWKNIKGLRNIIAHDYFGVDAEEIWSIIKLHIPALIESIRKIIR
ncbi:MAG: DUF86 domain-containing protein [Candidatus Latescibacteria bacterium]|nr:DUF86 domain-containing protein [Candidatus Latescibacterota bacterium]